MFASIGKHGCSSNMALDNLLAFLKQAARGFRNSRRLSSERLIHCGVLAPHMKAYLDHGHEDHRRLTVRRMKTEGAPVRMGKQAAQQRSRRGQHQARPHLSYSFSRRSELRRPDPQLTQKEASKIAMDEWRAGAQFRQTRSLSKRILKHLPKPPRVRCSSMASIWGPRWPVKTETLVGVHFFFARLGINCPRIIANAE